MRIPVLALVLASFGVAFADDSGDDGSPSGREPRVADPSSDVLDAPPSDEVDESAAGQDEPPTRRRRRWTDGPRRIPTPGGASLARATRLGLGTHDVGTDLLHHPARPEWIRAAGNTRPRSLRWPVDVGAIGRGFGFVRHDRPHVRHNGFDIATPRGMVIRAAADGIVAYANNELRGYGSVVLLVHANGWMTLYAHADRITVQPGYRVRRGERIGFVGMTGRADGPHLHFELHVDGQAVDPRGYFEGEPWVRGREQLAVLRRNHGGHTYGHLGEIEPDFGADRPSPARARTAPSRPSRGSPARTARATPAPTAPTAPAVARTTTPPVLTPTVARTAPTATPTAARTSPTPTVARTMPPASTWLTDGPTVAERRALRAHPVTEWLPPIRLELEPTFASGALHYETPVGTNVRAAATGRVVFVGTGIHGPRTSIVVIHENGFVSVYSAMMDPTVEVGAVVEVGDRLGIVRDETTGVTFALRDRTQPLDPRRRFTTRSVVASRE